MLCLRDIMLPVCLSGTVWYYDKMANLGIIKAMPTSQGTLAFVYQRSPRNSDGVKPNRGAKYTCMA